uniref:Stomatal closure-related actin-binding protein coiled-coil domain-containing protein n=1 Tax=Aegilops tauschii subsp. strangulata TaxID=200361 RepID=A0A452XFT9_AEGTS
MKFEKGLSTATLLSNEVKCKQVALLERDILLKNLKSVLESLRGQVAGKYKDEFEESVSMVDILAVQLSKRENELLQQKTEVTRIATSLKLLLKMVGELLTKNELMHAWRLKMLELLYKEFKKYFKRKRTVHKELESSNRSSC